MQTPAPVDLAYLLEAYKVGWLHCAPPLLLPAPRKVAVPASPLASAAPAAAAAALSRPPGLQHTPSAREKS